MQSLARTVERLSSIPHLQLTRNEPLMRHTRFALGGPADVFAETPDEAAFVAALQVLEASAAEWIVIGCGTNLIVSDAGYRGVVLRFTGAQVSVSGTGLHAAAGALLQDVVDAALAAGLGGMERLTGIPGSLGAAIYGNAGAYGASLSDVVEKVRAFDGSVVREFDREGCGFRYRESEFKRRRLAGEAWLVLSAELALRACDAAAMRLKAAEILATRNAKFPPELQCAGSIFKNLLLDELPAAARAAVPASVLKGGKVPVAWFLEQAGARGLSRGAIRVKDDHANTLYNAGGGTAAEFCQLVAELKQRVAERYGLTIEEEVQYIGFQP